MKTPTKLPFNPVAGDGAIRGDRAKPALDLAAKKIEEIPLKLLHCGPWQKRTASKADIAAMAADIRVHGLLQPLLVRHTPDDSDAGYQIVYGNTRAAALTINKTGVAPCIVANVDDATAAMMAASENFQRRALTPMEEAAVIGELIATHEYTYEEIAAQWGCSATYVARRAKLLDLIPEIQQRVGGAVSDLDEEFTRAWPAASVGVLEDLARLSDGQQRSALELIERSPYQIEQVLGSRTNLRLTLLGLDLRTLGTASWKLDDAVLYPVAGACTDCPQRSDKQQFLFDDLEHGDAKKALCLDPACWAEKAQRHTAGIVAAAKTKHGADVVLVRREPGYGPEGLEPIEGLTVYRETDGRLERSKPSDEAGTDQWRRAIIIGGAGIGQIRWFKPYPSRTSNRQGAQSAKDAGSGKSGKLDLAERERLLERRRRVHVCAAVNQRIMPEKVAELLTEVAAELMFRLLAATVYDRPAMSDLDTLQVAFRTLDGVKARAELSQRLAFSWASRINAQSGDVDAVYADAEFLAGYLEVDFAALRRAAEEDIPEPKSWAKERSPTKPPSSAKPSKGPTWGKAVGRRENCATTIGPADRDPSSAGKAESVPAGPSVASKKSKSVRSLRMKPR